MLPFLFRYFFLSHLQREFKVPSITANIPTAESVIFLFLKCYARVTPHLPCYTQKKIHFCQISPSDIFHQCIWDLEVFDKCETDLCVSNFALCISECWIKKTDLNWRKQALVVVIGLWNHFCGLIITVKVYHWSCFLYFLDNGSYCGLLNCTVSQFLVVDVPQVESRIFNTADCMSPYYFC